MKIMNKRNAGRALALLLGCMLALSAISSASFISAHALHDCCGAGCGVCAMLSAAASLTGRFFMAAILLCAAALAVIFITAAESVSNRENTPLLLKVRLNN